METVELWYAVYGTDVISSVEIELGATAKQVREAVASEHHWKDGPAQLVLYIAKETKEDGGTSTYLKNDTHLGAFLTQGSISHKYAKMPAPLTRYFGSHFKPEESEIHVLVQPPREIINVAQGEPTEIDVRIKEINPEQ